jgi:hypothetical protein
MRSSTRDKEQMLIPRLKVDLEVGGMGKRHMSMHYDYSNVHPPAGVQVGALGRCKGRSCPAWRDSGREAICGKLLPR